MAEQAEILEDDADAASERGERTPWRGRDIGAQQGQPAACRPFREIEQPQHAGFARA